MSDEPIEVKNEEKDEDGCWKVLLACLIANVGLGGVTHSYGILMQDMKNVFQVELSELAFAGSAFMGSSLIFGPVAAGIANSLGLCLTCSIGSFVMMISMLATCFSKGIWTFVVFYGIISGFGASLVIIVASTSCQFFFKKNKALAVGLAKCGVPLGTFIMPPVASYVLELYGWTRVMILYAFVFFVITFVANLIPPKPNPKALDRKDSFVVEVEVPKIIVTSPDEPVQVKEEVKVEEVILDGGQVVVRRNRPIKSALKKSIMSALDPELIKDKTFIILILSRILGFLCLESFYIFYPDYLIKNDISIFKASLILSSLGIAATFGRVSYGLFSDLTKASPTILMGLGLAVSGAVLLAMPYLPMYLNTYCIIAVTYGFFNASFQGIYGIALVELFGVDKMTAAYGLSYFVQGFGTMIGPTLTGLAAEYNNFKLLFLVGGLLYLSASFFNILALILHKKARSSSEETIELVTRL